MRYTKQDVRDAVASARSLAEALRTLGLRPAGGNHRTLHRLIAKFGIPVDHLDANWAQRRAPRNTATPLSEILVERSTYHRGHLKDRLFAEGVKERQCELCGLGDEWRGRPMSLILDHINGVANDNRLENLQIVCPNCAATLETHCGRKNRIDREPRACLHCGAGFIPNYPSHRYCSQRCGTHSKGSHDPQPERRKVPRPSHDQLLLDLQATSFVAVGRKYGVSDNAVRKWLRYYGADRRRAGSDLAANSGLGGPGGEAGDLGTGSLSATDDEGVVLADPVGSDDLDRDLGAQRQAVSGERPAEVEGAALTRRLD